MPRPKNAKVWNEDLITALSAREQMAHRNGQRCHMNYRNGRVVIESIRKDIYMYNNSTNTDPRIANFPHDKLTTTIDNLCRQIIYGKEPILPPGYVDYTKNQQCDDHCNYENPYTNDPYLKSIKKRGGAYAILMAFYTASNRHHQYLNNSTSGSSSTNIGSNAVVLSKEDICELAQSYCDTDMDANYMAGRSRGAWSSIQTLQKHDLIIRIQNHPTRSIQNNNNNNNTKLIGGGSYSYMLTQNGVLFLDAYIQRHPDIQEQFNIQSSNNNTTTTHNETVVNRNGNSSGMIGNDKIINITNRINNNHSCSTIVSSSSITSTAPTKFSPSRRPFSALTPISIMDDDDDDDDIEVLDNIKGSAGHDVHSNSCNHPTVAKRRLMFDVAPNEGRLKKIEKYKGLESNIVPKTINSTAAPTSYTTSTRSSPSVGLHQNQKVPLPSLSMNTLFDNEDDDNDDDSNRKIPAASKKAINNHSTGTDMVRKVPPILHVFDSDSDDDDILLYHSGLRKNATTTTASAVTIIPKPQKCEDNKHVFDLTDSQPSEIIDDNDPQLLGINDIQEEARTRSATLTRQLLIYIDDRERNRNHTPRTLRMELTRLVSSSDHGLLSMIWPRNNHCIPRPIVEEHRIMNGDFAFHHRSLLESSAAISFTTNPIPILVERKRIGDIVQRSTQKDHWYQLQRMQDEVIGYSCENGACIVLLEGDPRTTTKYIPYGSQQVDNTSPFVHTIDDEETYYRFMIRAILNDQSQATRFIQTKDEQGTLRMIGVLGLMAISNKTLLKVDQSKIPKLINTKVERINIIRRFKSCGIPWTLISRITDEIRSIPQMDQLYSSSYDISCRKLMLVPLISDVCESADELSNSTPSAWSRAVYQAWNTKLSDLTDVCKQIVNTASTNLDMALFLEMLHDGCSENVAKDKSFVPLANGDKDLARVVCIDLPKEFLNIFQSETNSKSNSSFFRLTVTKWPQKIPSIVMQTFMGNYYSSKLHVFLIDGQDIVQRIQSEMNDTSSGRNTDYVALAKRVAGTLYRDFSAVVRKDDNLILLIRAMDCALDNAAKKQDYRSEIRVIAEMIQIELMIEHKTVVINAVRLRSGDREMIVRQIALSCYHYQILTYNAKLMPIMK